MLASWPGAPLPSCRVPLATVVAPVYAAVPMSTREPVPDICRLSCPFIPLLLSASTPPNVVEALLDPTVSVFAPPAASLTTRFAAERLGCDSPPIVVSFPFRSNTAEVAALPKTTLPAPKPLGSAFCAPHLQHAAGNRRVAGIAAGSREIERAAAGHGQAVAAGDASLGGQQCAGAERHGWRRAQRHRRANGQRLTADELEAGVPVLRVADRHGGAAGVVQRTAADRQSAGA